MSIATELVTLVHDICRQRVLPAVTWLHLPPERPRDPHHKKFGALLLADGSCGFFFTRLDGMLGRIRTHIDIDSIIDTPVLELAAGYTSSDPLQRTLGLGALNAISQHLFSSDMSCLEYGSDPLGQMEVTTADHVGMVGFFRPLVRMLEGRKIALTVIEKDALYLDYGGPVKVTLDTAALQSCDRVLVTASTLLNDTLESVLASCAPHAKIALIGPTVGCLPDPFFSRGVNVVGGASVADLPKLKTRLEAGDNWDESVTKYCIANRHYPGAKASFLPR
jgi:uncharacterized protein (DUF4213/DUF364 family)